MARYAETPQWRVRGGNFGSPYNYQPIMDSLDQWSKVNLSLMSQSKIRRAQQAAREDAMTGQLQQFAGDTATEQAYRETGNRYLTELKKIDVDNRFRDIEAENPTPEEAARAAQEAMGKVLKDPDLPPEVMEDLQLYGQKKSGVLMATAEAAERQRLLDADLRVFNEREQGLVRSIMESYKSGAHEEATMMREDYALLLDNAGPNSANPLITDEEIGQKMLELNDMAIESSIIGEFRDLLASRTAFEAMQYIQQVETKRVELEDENSFRHLIDEGKRERLIGKLKTMFSENYAKGSNLRAAAEKAEKDALDAMEARYYRAVYEQGPNSDEAVGLYDRLKDRVSPSRMTVIIDRTKSGQTELHVRNLDALKVELLQGHEINNPIDFFREGYLSFEGMEELQAMIAERGDVEFTKTEAWRKWLPKQLRQDFRKHSDSTDPLARFRAQDLQSGSDEETRYYLLVYERMKELVDEYKAGKGRYPDLHAVYQEVTRNAVKVDQDDKPVVAKPPIGAPDDVEQFDVGGRNVWVGPDGVMYEDDKPPAQPGSAAEQMIRFDALRP